MEHVLWNISDSANVKGPLSFTVKNVIKTFRNVSRISQISCCGDSGRADGPHELDV